MIEQNFTASFSLNLDFFLNPLVKCIMDDEYGSDTILFFLNMAALCKSFGGRLKKSNGQNITKKELEIGYCPNKTHAEECFDILCDYTFIMVDESGEIKINNDFIPDISQNQPLHKKRGYSIDNFSGIDEKRYGGNGLLTLKRDNFTCQMCGGTKYLCIHHKNGFSSELTDLVTLCIPCHRKVHGKNYSGSLIVKKENM